MVAITWYLPGSRTTARESFPVPERLLTAYGLGVGKAIDVAGIRVGRGVGCAVALSTEMAVHVGEVTTVLSGATLSSPPWPALTINTTTTSATTANAITTNGVARFVFVGLPSCEPGGAPAAPRGGGAPDVSEVLFERGGGGESDLLVVLLERDGSPGDSYLGVSAFRPCCALRVRSYSARLF